jgi:hypothetical protein
MDWKKPGGFFQPLITAFAAQNPDSEEEHGK